MLQRGVARRHLQDAAEEPRQRRIEIRAREVRRSRRDRLAFGIAGRRGDAEADRRDVFLARVEQRLRELGRLAEAERQQSGGQRIERPGVAGLLGADRGASRAAARRST